MTKIYCLTVEVESKAIKNGLGYMIAFTVPDEKLTPAQTKDFAEWSDKVKQAVLRAGDQVYDPDPYTKKLAIAELMHDLSALNDSYPIKITGWGDLPAVQVQSTNPYDNRLEMDFTGKDGRFNVVEKGLADLERRAIAAHGNVDVVDGSRRHFPFRQNPPVAPPAIAPPAPKRPKPPTP